MIIEHRRAPAAWYWDPLDTTRLRYFDGSLWTEHVAFRLASPPTPPAPATAATDATDAAEPAADLATNRPGAAARAKAIEIRRAAPVRTLVARVLRVDTDERAWRIGADGEEEVGRRLAKLGNNWGVLHAVPVGVRGSDIDHVVIGPPGVFTLNTKNHSGKRVWVAERSFMVSGQRTDYLRNSRFEAHRTSGLLFRACGFDVPVEPVIVVMAEKLTVKAQPDGVHVVSHRRIVEWLKARSPVLTPEGVAEVYGAARSSATWR